MLSPGINDKLVHVAVEGFVREIGELVNGSPVVVFLLGPLAESVVLAVFPSQDSSAARVKPVSGAFL